jgi:threonine-phosphate decarboxylase
MASTSITHGGRALAFARERRLDYREVMDFSANINPLGPSPLALDALKQSLDLIKVYPDEFSVRLTHAISDRLHVAEKNILPGNGATDLMYFWLRTLRPRSATLIVPTFAEYRKALESIGAAIQIVSLSARDHFRLPAISVSTDVVLLTNPNNPTGAYAPPEEMADWIAGIPSTAHVFIDEAFVEFTAQPSLVRYIDRFPNLWILRSMTKFYGMAGLRLGYLAGSGVPSLIAHREPWQVNSLAELAGIVSLGDRAHEESTLQLIQRERIWLWKKLQRLTQIRAFPTAANFFLACGASDVLLDRLIGTLAEQRILIRDCRGIEGLAGPYFRFAIKTRPENTRLLGYLEGI